MSRITSAIADHASGVNSFWSKAVSAASASWARWIDACQAISAARAPCWAAESWACATGMAAFSSAIPSAILASS